MTTNWPAGRQGQRACSMPVAIGFPAEATSLEMLPELPDRTIATRNYALTARHRSRTAAPSRPSRLFAKPPKTNASCLSVLTSLQVLGGLFHSGQGVRGGPVQGLELLRVSGYNGAEEPAVLGCPGRASDMVITKQAPGQVLLAGEITLAERGIGRSHRHRRCVTGSP